MFLLVKPTVWMRGPLAFSEEKGVLNAEHWSETWMHRLAAILIIIKINYPLFTDNTQIRVFTLTMRIFWRITDCDAQRYEKIVFDTISKNQIENNSFMLHKHEKKGICDRLRYYSNSANLFETIDGCWNYAWRSRHNYFLQNHQSLITVVSYFNSLPSIAS